MIMIRTNCLIFNRDCPTPLEVMQHSTGYTYDIGITKNILRNINDFHEENGPIYAMLHSRKIMRIRYHCTRFVKMLDSEVGPKLASVKDDNTGYKYFPRKVFISVEKRRSNIKIL